MPGNLLSHASHRDIIAAVSAQPHAYTFAPAILRQKEAVVYWREESIAFPWQGLESVAKAWPQIFTTGMTKHFISLCSPQTHLQQEIHPNPASAVLSYLLRSREDDQCRWYR